MLPFHSLIFHVMICHLKEYVLKGTTGGANGKLPNTLIKLDLFMLNPCGPLNYSCIIYWKFCARIVFSWKLSLFHIGCRKHFSVLRTKEGLFCIKDQEWPACSAVFKVRAASRQETWSLPSWGDHVCHPSEVGDVGNLASRRASVLNPK